MADAPDNGKQTVSNMAGSKRSLIPENTTQVPKRTRVATRWVDTTPAVSEEELDYNESDLGEEQPMTHSSGEASTTEMQSAEEGESEFLMAEDDLFERVCQRRGKQTKSQVSKGNTSNFSGQCSDFPSEVNPVLHLPDALNTSGNATIPIPDLEKADK